MDVQVGSLGEFGQKGVQRQRALMHGGIKGAGGAKFRLGSVGFGSLGVREDGNRGKGEAGESESWAAHDCLQV
jgi:hypothetical protein